MPAAPHLDRMKSFALALSALFLTACAATSRVVEAPPAPLYHYVRSNNDGSLPEHIYVYQPNPTRLEVGKMVTPCTNAAFVTAELDRERGQPSALVGGRLARDSSQDAFAWLSYDPATRAVHARVPTLNVDETRHVAGEPWLLYDFDLADLNGLFAGRAPPRADFRFAALLIWPDGSEAGVLRDMGFANARFVSAEQHNGREALRFDVTGGLTGQLWLDARQGFVIEAAFDQPNHMEYETFRLVLQNVHEDGEAQWAAVRRTHWEGCAP